MAAADTGATAKAFRRMAEKYAQLAQCYMCLDFWARAESWRGTQDYFEARAKEATHHEQKFLKYIDRVLNLKVQVPGRAEESYNFLSLKECWDEHLVKEEGITTELQSLAEWLDTHKDSMGERFVMEELEDQEEAMDFLRDVQRRLVKDGDNQAALRKTDALIGKHA